MNFTKFRNMIADLTFVFRFLNGRWPIYRGRERWFGENIIPHLCLLHWALAYGFTADWMTATPI